MGRAFNAIGSLPTPIALCHSFPSILRSLPFRWMDLLLCMILPRADFPIPVTGNSFTQSNGFPYLLRICKTIWSKCMLSLQFFRFIHFLQRQLPIKLHFLCRQSQLSGANILLHKGSASYFLQRNMRLRDSYGQNLRNEYRRAIMKIATTLNHISKSKNDFLF